MTAGRCRLFTVVGVMVMLVYFDASLQRATFQVCHACEGILQNGTAVGNFCTVSSGQAEGRCCLGTQGLDVDSITGLDLSNCSLREVKGLNEASTAKIMLLPYHLTCPGGNASWEKVETRGEIRLCEGQRNSCDQMGHKSGDCPENGLCAPDGPGFFQCRCTQSHHGYKCLREGQFPLAEVLGILGGATVLVSALLWVTQRRKAKSI
ncbi:all-trans retinoic acid-induced differentiation factor isoform X2 [Anguilla rostrata]|uniref:all-trans retinoic acid-induced differentiation factor isoform X2 n=1 Tax=Anguilla anguilla TaxID=7936 RepID=UPI0015A93F80|nr:all-trans retinoic acid-induced differentiation factor isoform X2 [Anguilla anguilla]